PAVARRGAVIGFADDSSPPRYRSRLARDPAGLPRSARSQRRRSRRHSLGPPRHPFRPGLRRFRRGGARFIPFARPRHRQPLPRSRPSDGEVQMTRAVLLAALLAAAPLAPAHAQESRLLERFYDPAEV